MLGKHNENYIITNRDRGAVFRQFFPRDWCRHVQQCFIRALMTSYIWLSSFHTPSVLQFFIEWRSQEGFNRHWSIQRWRGELCRYEIVQTIKCHVFTTNEEWRSAKRITISSNIKIKATEASSSQSHSVLKNSAIPDGSFQNWNIKENLTRK